MSLAGFQRRRRELDKQKELEEQSRIEENERQEGNDTSEQSTIEEKDPINTIDIDNITKPEIIELLMQKGIEHNPKDKKEILFDLLVEGE